MKKKETTRAMLGLTQQEMAMVLNVSRGQWAMYESGKRNLPAAAGLRLNEMMNYMISPEGKAPTNLSESGNDDNETKQLLEKRLKETEFQILAISRKINEAQQKWEKHEKAVLLMAFLNSPAEAKKAARPEILPSITTAATMNFKEAKSEWNVLQIDRDLLQLQQEYLQKILRKM